MRRESDRVESSAMAGSMQKAYRKPDITTAFRGPWSPPPLYFI